MAYTEKRILERFLDFVGFCARDSEASKFVLSRIMAVAVTSGNGTSLQRFFWVANEVDPTPVQKHGTVSTFAGGKQQCMVDDVAGD